MSNCTRSMMLMMTAAMGLFGTQSITSADDLTSPLTQLVNDVCVRSLGEQFAQELIDSQIPERKLLRILSGWGDQTSRFQSIRATFVQSEVNYVFQNETVSKGTFDFESQNRWRLELEAVKHKKSDSSRFRDKDGVPYSLSSGTPSLLMRIDDRFYFGSPDRKEFSSSDVAIEKSKKFQFQLPWQFAAVLDSVNFQGHFTFRLQKESNNEFVLLGSPFKRERSNKLIFDSDFFETMFVGSILGNGLVDSPVQIKLNRSTLLPTSLRTKEMDGLQWAISFESIVSDNLDPARESRISTDCLSSFVDITSQIQASPKRKYGDPLPTNALDHLKSTSVIPTKFVPTDSPY